MAFTLREKAETGLMPLPSGNGSVKEITPCLSGYMPVEILVHSIGEKGGSSVARLPIVPSFTNLSSEGI